VDLKDEAYEPLILIEHAKWAGIPFTELLKLSSYWRSWIALGYMAESNAKKRQAAESS
jgi:hypothetical protein